jgi:zinc transport system permease protein
MNTSFFTALFHNPFLQMSILAGLFASIASGVVGSYVVAKRVVFLSGSISHAVLGGFGLFVFLNHVTKNPVFHPLLGALISAVVFGFLIGWTHLYHKQREDSVIAAIWSLGMSVGVILISIVPGNNAELMNFLFGNLLWANTKDIYMLGVLDLLIVTISFLLHRRFLAISFDVVQSTLQKQPVDLLYFTLISLVSVTVVMMIQTIGAILLISLLCLPAVIANMITIRLSKMICLAVFFSTFFTLLGIYLSYHFNWPPGATIALIITLFYFLSLPLRARLL